MKNMVLTNNRISKPVSIKKTGGQITKIIIKNVLFYCFSAFLALVFLFPLLYMLASSGKTEMQYANSAGTIYMFLIDFTQLNTLFDNYISVFTGYEIWKYTVNTLLYAVAVIALNIFVNGLAGYVMAKFDFPGKGALSFMIIFLIVVPVETSIIPLYAIVKTVLGLKGSMSVLAVILPAAVSIFNIFLFIQFFSGIPKEYDEAARIDGANDLVIFTRITLPLSKPIIATVTTFCFIGVWNDYIWPTMVLPYSDSGWPTYPIQAALTSIQSISSVTTGEIMASLVIASVPIFVVYIVAQKYIVQGFGSAGLKM